MTQDICDITKHLFNSLFSGRSFLLIEKEEFVFFSKLIRENILYKEIDIEFYSDINITENGFTLLFSVNNLENSLEWNERHCPYVSIDVDFSRDWSAVDYGFD